MSLKGKSIISCRDLDKKDVDAILSLADNLFESLKKGRPLKTLEGKVLATLFFEPSTRTRLSFATAMERLGGSVIGFSSAEGTSVKKGETLIDTVRTVEQYADAIVMRHPMEGSARLAANSVNIPVINGGDGANQHPTQALLDLFTMKRERGLKNLKVALCGDLKYGRTVHSLLHLLSMYGLEAVLVSPEQLMMPEYIVESIENRFGLKPEAYHAIDDVIKWVDVLYITRIQKERFPDPNEYEKIAGSYYIDGKMLGNAKKNMIVMHPLPRVDEIRTDVDSTPHAKYFEQAQSGVAVRMALLSLIFGKGGL
jgi:aspartate carbamoyltransferase catalytic subunit